MRILYDTYFELEVIASESTNTCYNLLIYPENVPISIPKYLIQEPIEDCSNRIQKIKIPLWFLKKNRIIPLKS
jgi:hypothetical protein